MVTNDALLDLKLGDKNPYDFDGEWDSTPPPAKDWAERAVRGILNNLSDRAGVGVELVGVDADLRKEIVGELADIIRAAYEQGIP